MSTYHIINVLPDSTEFSLFQQVAESLYTKEQLALKSTEGINHALLHNCIVVLKNNIPVARACIYNNPELVYNNKKAVCVGNYECIDEPEVAGILLDEVTRQAKELQAEYIVGPMNGSTWDNYRFSLNNSHPNFFLEPYHHTYYNQQFISNNYQVIEQYESNIDHELDLFNETQQLAYQEKFRLLNVTVRPIDLLNYEKDIESLYTLSIQSFANNVLYTPISKEAFLQKYLPVKAVMNPEFVLVAENADQQLIGFIFCIHDLCCTEEKRLIIKTIARVPDKEYAGLTSFLFNHIQQKLIDQNYKSIVHAFMHIDNRSVHLSKKYSGQSYKHYALYGKEL